MMRQEGRVPPAVILTFLLSSALPQVCLRTDCLIFSILFSIFSHSALPFQHPTSFSPLHAEGKKRRLHSNYPAGSAHGDCSGCIKLITNQRQRDSEYALSADCVFIYTNLSVLHAGLLAIY